MAQRLAALGRREGVCVEVVAPVPVFPGVTRLRGGLPPAEEQTDGLRVHHPRYFYVPGVLKAWDARWYARGLRRWVAACCERFAPDVLDAHFIWPDGVGVSRLAREVGLQYVVTLRGWLLECLGNASMTRQCAEALSPAAAVISVSEELADAAIRLGAAQDKLHVIPNGVDTQRFRPRDKAEARRQLGLPAYGRLLVTVAHLGPRKGHEQTLPALAKLDGDVQLVIVGDDPEGGRRRRVLGGLAVELGIRERVVFAGPQPYDLVPAYYNAADASVLASHREGCPNVVLESLASGTPVVATEVGAVPELIEPGVNGRTVPARDADALAEAIREVLATEWSAEAVAASASVRSWDEVAAEVAGVLNGVNNVTNVASGANGGKPRSKTALTPALSQGERGQETA